MKTYDEFKDYLSEAADLSAPIPSQTLTPVDTAEKGGIYKHSQTGDYIIPTLKRVSLRGGNHITAPEDWYLHKHWSTINPAGKSPLPIGWFATKTNIAHGWALYSLSKFDRKWLKEGGILKTNGVVRISSYKGTNLAKFNLKTGVWAPMVDTPEGEPHNEKGELMFDKPAPYNRLVLDTQDAFHEFGFTFKIS